MKRNESKHIVNAYHTPAVLSIVTVILYILSSMLNIVGVGSLSQTAIYGL